MNILEQINRELKDKNWSLEEKIRYIYLESCRLFTYDERYPFIEDNNQQNKIKNKKLDLEHITDNRVVCTSHSNEALAILLKELLNIESEIIGKNHTRIIFYVYNEPWKADATISSDLSRVKMKLNTRGYKKMNSNYSYQIELKKIDQKINYIQTDYQNNYLKERANQLFQEFIQYMKSDDYNQYSDEFLIYQLYTVKEIFETYSFSNFSDAKYAIGYLMRKILQYNIENVIEIPLYQIITEEEWDCIIIYIIHLKNDTLFFTLKKEKNLFHFYEITQNDALHHTTHYEGTNKKLIYRYK